MKIVKRFGTMCATLCFACLTSARAAEESDQQMLRLAADRGCSFCHQLESGRPGTPDSPLSMAPSLKDIARKYRGQSDAVDQLTRTVLQGTGPNDRGPHWQASTSATGMFPNATRIDAEDARKLVRWILSLDK